jgi:hypothetical protein
MDFKEEIFKGKNFSNLLEDIYVNRNKKDEQIKILIEDIRPLVKSMSDATILVPLLKDYIEVGVKNDEQLVKMAAIVQRALSRTGEGPGSEDSEFKLSEEEKDELMRIYKETEPEKKERKSTKKFEDIVEEDTKES